jgi:hypothetical protein
MRQGQKLEIMAPNDVNDSGLDKRVTESDSPLETAIAGVAAAALKTIDRRLLFDAARSWRGGQQF